MNDRNVKDGSVTDGPPGSTGTMNGQVEFDLIDSIAGVPARDFDRLDSSAGAAGCYDRMRQRESDGRWLRTYLRCVDSDSGRLRALIPLYRSRGRTWPDPAYDPRTWDLPPGAADECTAAGSVIVGSYADLRTGLHVEPELRTPDNLRELLARIAAAAAEENRCLIFPFVFEEAQRALAAAEGAIAWKTLGEEAQLRGVADPGWESKLTGRMRRNFRLDRAAIAAAGLGGSMHAWHEVEEQVAELIAEHNIRLGRFDHTEFVKLRSRQWDRCEAVEFFVFAAESSTVKGYVTAWVWEDELDLYEVGLHGEPGPDRFAAYVDLAFIQPLRFAQARGLNRIRLGMAAGQTKAVRGAVFTSVYGGVLNARETKRLAG
jgi:hypothetical protein